MQVNYITNGARNIKPLASVYGSMATRLIAQKLEKIKAFEALEDVVRLTNHQTPPTTHHSFSSRVDKLAPLNFLNAALRW